MNRQVVTCVIWFSPSWASLHENMFLFTIILALSIGMYRRKMEESGNVQLQINPSLKFITAAKWRVIFLLLLVFNCYISNTDDSVTFIEPKTSWGQQLFWSGVQKRSELVEVGVWWASFLVSLGVCVCLGMCESVRGLWVKKQQSLQYRTSGDAAKLILAMSLI